ncbi:Hypothetical protein LUCI_2096 [Lucifera butyrica]|uniref:Pyridinium-3,5-bisthiocarboxylic acid mononucleotide nickel insertion protein n=1 Tax=Lucifera butyrica TaxID=1351585 RepID=A0A498R6N1_9FIRM|nr:nickel pincer cofactor biosynthesis protein LarC [Lucifera butyrica]VBB06859.1 Hypothetical protein LUCI_2096 [Lucifera butyrica]
MKALYLDCFAGISGNMLLGALLDAGVPEDLFRKTLASLPLSGYELIIQRVNKGGIDANYVDVKLAEHDHHHRHLADIFRIIEQAPLEEAVKEQSKRVFSVLAAAEAKVHGTTPDKIHFHEVGAVDAIVDILGTVWCLNYLGVQQIFASKLHVGSGSVLCSHGWMPVPAPATAELLIGIPYYSGDIAKELVTPTGAAILAALGTGFGRMPENFLSEKIGYGAGTWDLAIPNVLRLQLGSISSAAKDEVILLETNIDDLNPQAYSYILDRLLNSGALDAWLTPVIMKKSRPAVLLSVLMPQDKQDIITDILFAETSTIGVRYFPVERTKAQRQIHNVSTPWGMARVKISTYRGATINVSPEFEDCKSLAEEHGVPFKQIWQEIWQLGMKLAANERT